MADGGDAGGKDQGCARPTEETEAEHEVPVLGTLGDEELGCCQQNTA